MTPSTASNVLPPDVVRLRRAARGGTAGAHVYVALLGLRTYTTRALLEQLRKGLPYSALERFQRNVQLPMNELAALLQIPLRTLNRRKEQGRFHQDESDRLVRASRVFARALDLFEGDLDAAKRWLTSPQAALSGNAPLGMAQTEVGSREVEQLIGRIEHGIPS